MHTSKLSYGSTFIFTSESYNIDFLIKLLAGTWIMSKYISPIIFELIVKMTSQCKTETPSVSVGHRPFRPKHGSTLQ